MKFGRNLQSIAIAMVLYLVLGSFLLFVVLPLGKKMAETKKELDTKNTEVKNVTKTIVSGMNQFKKEFDALENEYVILGEKLPTRDSFPELLNQISKQTEKLSVEVMSINRLAEVEDDELKIKVVPIIIDIVTDYKTLGDYLDALAEINIAVNMRRLIITKDEKNLSPPRLRVAVELETYISLVE